jgi:citrate synthase
MTAPNPGLRNVEAVESSITAITPDGLFLRGFPLDTLLGEASFEETAFVLWHDRQPAVHELIELRQQYVRGWLLPQEAINVIQGLPQQAEPLWALQAALPLLAITDPDRDDTSEAARHRQAVRILGQVPATIACRHWGMPVARLDANASLASQVFRALGAKPLPAEVADAALILYADHELAASTFVARVAAAARASLHDGMGAAVAVLKGPLHGGSTLEVAAMLRRIVEARPMEAMIASTVADSPVIPGFGHAVYRGGDPRAVRFRQLAEHIATGEARRWLDAATALEARVERERGLHANVDLYAVVFMHAAGFRAPTMLAFFAVARSAGWLAHMLEQQHNNRLIRPRARYTGKLGRAWE